MNWKELNEARNKIGLTQLSMAMLLNVSLSTYKGWGVRGKVPKYIGSSVRAHLALSKEDLEKLTY